MVQQFIINDYVFVTDVHVGAGTNNRTGSVYEDVFRKLRFVVDYCNEHKATLLDGGDFFDKPTIADVYKSELMDILSACKYGVYSVPGNHSVLFNNYDDLSKTSLNIMYKSGVMKPLTHLQFENVLITSQKPLTTTTTPVIAVFHGFLNKTDGVNTVEYTDLIGSKTDTQVLLGHDHTVYEPLKMGSVTIHRPGSMLRGIRLDEQMRVPQLVHLRVKGDTIKYKYVDIDCRDCKEIFTTKTATMKGSEVAQTYEHLIQQIASANKNEQTFDSALDMVTTPDVKEYILNVLNDANVEQDSK